MAERHPSIGEGRSLGLFSALELVKNRETRDPIVPQIDPTFEFSGVMRELSTFMLEHGVSTMTRWNWVFINPPLTITEDELRSGLKVLDAALDIADQAIT